MKEGEVEKESCCTKHDFEKRREKTVCITHLLMSQRTLMMSQGAVQASHKLYCTTDFHLNNLIYLHKENQELIIFSKLWTEKYLPQRENNLISQTKHLKYLFSTEIDIGQLQLIFSYYLAPLMIHSKWKYEAWYGSFQLYSDMFQLWWSTDYLL